MLRNWLPVRLRRLLTVRPGSRRPYRHNRLRVEGLEERTVPTATPAVALSVDPSPFIGTSGLDQSLTFSNTGTSPGYGPWAYVVLPATGADGNDGITFVDGSANYLGAAVTTNKFTVDASGTVTGPAYARGATGTPIQLTGLTQNDQVVFFQLPFGSFAAGQPGATIQFKTNVSNLADVNKPLTETAGSGFEYGNDALDNQASDPAIVGATTTATTTPTLFRLTKTYIGPENETATGSNYTRQYKIDVAIAPGQVLSNLDLTDALPNSTQFVSVNSVTSDGTNVGYTLTSTPSTSTPGGTLTTHLTSSITGSGAANDAEVLFTFYVPRDRTDSTQVLNLDTGDFTQQNNTASVAANWTPIDSRDPAGPVSQTLATPVTVTEKSIATQKSVAVVGGGEVVQGATLEYTLDFQVSDYFAFQNVNLADVLGDGLRFDSSFVPTLEFTSHTGSTAAANFTGAGNVTVGGVNADGTQNVGFAISNELIQSRARWPDGWRCDSCRRNRFGG